MKTGSWVPPHGWCCGLTAHTWQRGLSKALFCSEGCLHRRHRPLPSVLLSLQVLVPIPCHSWKSAAINPANLSLPLQSCPRGSWAKADQQNVKSTPDTNKGDKRQKKIRMGKMQPDGKEPVSKTSQWWPTELSRKLFHVHNCEHSWTSVYKINMKNEISRNHSNK